MIIGDNVYQCVTDKARPWPLPDILFGSLSKGIAWHRRHHREDDGLSLHSADIDDGGIDLRVNLSQRALHSRHEPRYSLAWCAPLCGGRSAFWIRSCL